MAIGGPSPTSATTAPWSYAGKARKHGGAVVLPADYVAEHVDLGYAITAHRAQGLTVDTAHVVVSDTTTRENLYVAMTRGREHNHAYVIVDTADDNHGAPDGEGATAKSVLLGVLANSGAELSAHQMIKTEQDAWTSIAQLAAEYETIAAAAQRDRWASLIRSCSLTPEEADSAIESEAFGPLTAELRRAEANGHDIERLLPAAVARYGLDDAEDVASVLRYRLALATRAAGTGRGRRPAKLIVGLIPEALGPMAPDMRQALDERRNLIEQRARTLADDAIRRKVPWTRALGPRPADRAYTCPLGPGRDHRRRLPGPVRHRGPHAPRPEARNRQPAPRPRPSARLGTSC